MSKNEILKRLWSIEMSLSPENLSCDGELSKSQVQVRYQKLITEQRKLHKELGYAPGFSELFENYKKGLGEKR